MEGVNMEKNYIDVPFDDKELAKQLGARWDNEKKSWFYYDRSQISKVKKWFPPEIEKVFVPTEVPQKLTFYTGEEILNYLGVQRSYIKFDDGGFCGMCDSSIYKDWTFSNVHLCCGVGNKWKTLTNTERAILYHYLYITEPHITNDIESKYNELIKLLFR